MPCACRNLKSQAPNLRVSGVGCQVSGKKNKNLKPEFCSMSFVIPQFLNPLIPISQICNLKSTPTSYNK